MATSGPNAQLTQGLARGMSKEGRATVFFPTMRESGFGKP